MDWKSVAESVSKVAPLLGGLIGGPVGAGVAVAAKLVSSVLGCDPTPDAISAAMATNPDAAVKLAQVEADQKVHLQTLTVQAEANRLAAETASVQAVNATAQAEAKSDHWPTYSWRPFIGFCVGFNTAAASVLVLVVYGGILAHSQEAAAALAQLPTVLGALAAISATVLPILGIASYFRGKMQADPSVPTDNRG